jgi:hypothetical protein
VIESELVMKFTYGTPLHLRATTHGVRLEIGDECVFLSWEDWSGLNLALEALWEDGEEE